MGEFTEDASRADGRRAAGFVGYERWCEEGGAVDSICIIACYTWLIAVPADRDV